MEEKKICGAKEAAAYLKVSERTLYRLLAAGAIPPGSRISRGRGHAQRAWTTETLDNAIYKLSRVSLSKWQR